MNAALPHGLQVFIGVAEVVAAVGLTVPGLTRIQPWLVAAAAAGLTIVMICAAFFHASRGEWSSAATTLVLFALTAFVAYMRWRILPIRGREVRS
ncbi:MAG: DoxX family protein, partial [Gemmatimonadaceae bacterium]